MNAYFPILLFCFNASLLNLSRSFYSKVKASKSKEIWLLHSIFTRPSLKFHAHLASILS